MMIPEKKLKAFLEHRRHLAASKSYSRKKLKQQKRLNKFLEAVLVITTTGTLFSLDFWEFFQLSDLKEKLTVIMGALAFVTSLIKLIASPAEKMKDYAERLEAYYCILKDFDIIQKNIEKNPHYDKYQFDDDFRSANYRLNDLLKPERQLEGWDLIDKYPKYREEVDRLYPEQEWMIRYEEPWRKIEYQQL